MKKFLFFSVVALSLGIYFAKDLSVAHDHATHTISKVSKTAKEIKADADDTYSATSAKVKEYRSSMERTQAKVRKAYNALNPNND